MKSRICSASAAYYTPTTRTAGWSPGGSFPISTAASCRRRLLSSTAARPTRGCCWSRAAGKALPCRIGPIRQHTTSIWPRECWSATPPFRLSRWPCWKRPGGIRASSRLMGSGSTGATRRVAPCLILITAPPMNIARRRASKLATTTRRRWGTAKTIVSAAAS